MPARCWPYRREIVIATYTLEIAGSTVTTSYEGKRGIEKGDKASGFVADGSGKKTLISGTVESVLECEIHSA
jgi:hypothetical protein